jgi:pimeloyl-ACP methyl ester carboxylesterase
MQPRRVEFEPTLGVTLVGDEWGTAGPEVLLLGGAGQTRQAWGATGSRLGAAGFHAQAFDHRGHGESTWVGPGGYEMDAFVDDTASLARSTPEPPAIVGASLGGLAALIGIGLRRSVKATALVLVDIAPRIEMSGARRVLGFMAAYPDGFESLDEASRAIALYLNRDRPSTTDGLSRVLRPAGDRWLWHWDPHVLNGIGRLLDGDAATAAARAEVVSDLLHEAARNLDLPTLLVRGGLSDVVSQEGADEFLRAAPQARFVDVTDAGHMVAGDQNDIFGDVIVDFLTEVSR